MLALALVILSGASVVPIFWNPLSDRWNEVKAIEAMKRHDYSSAIRYFNAALNRGGSPDYNWYYLAEIYGYQENMPEYRNALDHLRAVDSQDADKVEKNYGPAK